MLEETNQKIVESNFFRRCRSSVWVLKHLSRAFVACIIGLPFALKKDKATQDKATNTIFYILSWFRVVCKSLFGLGCLGVCGYAIALPFCRPLQTFLGFDLRGFTKLLFAHNISAIFKLIAVAGSALYVTIHYLAKSGGSIYALAYLGSKYEGSHTDKSFCEFCDDEYFGTDPNAKEFRIGRFTSWATEDIYVLANRPFKLLDPGKDQRHIE
jgi:hypothetical protein